MSTALGRKIQYTPFLYYFPGDNSCSDGGDCESLSTDPERPCFSTNGLADWNYDNAECPRNCRDTQPLCSKPGPCPILGVAGDFNVGGWVSPESRTNSLSQGREYTCSYNLDDFQTVEDIKIWREFFINNEPDLDIRNLNTETYNTSIMPHFCSFPEDDIDTCPEYLPYDTGTGPCASGFTGCGRITSNSEAGSLCIDWKNTVESSPLLYGYYNTAIETYCGANLCANDCLCVNRNIVDPFYQQIVNTQGAPPPAQDHCWYAPCKNPTLYLVRAESPEKPSSCPTTVCQQVISIISSDDSNVDVDVESQIIDCDATSDSSTTNNNVDNNTGSIWRDYKNWVYLIGGIIILIVIIIGIVLVMHFMKKQKDEPTDGGSGDNNDSAPS